MGKRYCAYYRVSTDRQGISGLGLEAQKEAVENYLASKGGTLEIDFIEFESGKKNKRQRLSRLLTITVNIKFFTLTIITPYIVVCDCYY